MHTHPYEHLRRIVPADLEIHEVTTGVSLSTGTSPTTESITSLNPEINPEKYEHPCQAWAVILFFLASLSGDWLIDEIISIVHQTLGHPQQDNS